MAQVVNLPDYVLNEARLHAGVNSRSVPKQIEYWFRIGKIAEENPDLPYAFIKELLLSQKEAESGKLTDYEFG